MQRGTGSAIAIQGLGYPLFTLLLMKDSAPYLISSSEVIQLQ